MSATSPTRPAGPRNRLDRRPAAGRPWPTATNHDTGSFPDLIFVSLENWDEVWRRNQFLCDTLARRFPGTKLLFVGPARDVSNALRRGRLRELRATSAAWTVPATPNVTVTRPLKLLPNSLALGRWFNAGLQRRHVRRVARRLGLRAPALWLNDHHAVPLAGGALDEQAVVYDVTDDWIAFAASPSERELIRRRDAELCVAADAVITCSERLFQDKQKLARRVHLIPNGVHAEHYARVLDGCGPLPPAAAAWPKPVAGYLGTVHPSRVDVDLVAAVARQLPGGGSIVLLGPDHLPEPDRARLRSLGNVFLVPAVPYAQAPDYLRAFDVCLVPHVVTPFTESLNPIKLWEYLAAGKPIVSTRVAGFRDYPEHVALADTAEEFAAAIGRALAEDPERGRKRRSAAAAHSWSARVDAVVDVVREACARRRSNQVCAP